MNDKRSEDKYNVFIVDDHPIVCQGLGQLIEQEADLHVCGDAGDIASALESIAVCSPDIAIIDITLGQNSGVRLIEDLSHLYPDILILALSMHDESIYAERCLKAGARGYIMKQEPPELVISALRKILNGEIYTSDNLRMKLINKLVSPKSDIGGSSIEMLSNRELEVFRLIGDGLKTSEIADKLSLSVKTIETYIDHIKKKMKIKDLRGVIKSAAQWLVDQNLN